MCSYEVASITAISRVTDASRKQDAGMDGEALAAVAADGGAVIVENTGALAWACLPVWGAFCAALASVLRRLGAKGRARLGAKGRAQHRHLCPTSPLHMPADGTLQPAQNVYIANARFGSDAANTEFQIELDIPSTDNIMGWLLELEFIPGSTGEATVVKDQGGAATFYLPRLAGAKNGNRLRITLPVAEFSCNPGTGTWGACTGGGKFRLSTFVALSWFKASGEAVYSPDARGDVVSASDFTRKTAVYGSPRGSAAPWDAVFYVGEGWERERGHIACAAKGPLRLTGA